MTDTSFDRTRIAPLLAPLTEIVTKAADAILAVDRARMATVDKDDGSPVTAADFAADKVIAEQLARLAPDIPVVSEERKPPFATPYDGAFFLVDPLDGTKEYVAGHNDYAVNIALIVGGEPVAGVIGAPAQGVLWRGAVGHRAERLERTQSGYSVSPIATRRWPENWIAAVSRSHGDPRTAAFLARHPGGTVLKMGSSLKFCRLAEAEVDVYPRLAPTSEWDIAAGCAIVAAAGGRIIDASGHPLRFGQSKSGFLVPEFIAFGDPARANC